MSRIALFLYCFLLASGFEEPKEPRELDVEGEEESLVRGSGVSAGSYNQPSFLEQDATDATDPEGSEHMMKFGDEGEGEEISLVDGKPIHRRRASRGKWGTRRKAKSSGTVRAEAAAAEAKAAEAAAATARDEARAADVAAAETARRAEEEARSAGEPELPLALGDEATAAADDDEVRTPTFGGVEDEKPSEVAEGFASSGSEASSSPRSEDSYETYKLPSSKSSESSEGDESPAKKRWLKAVDKIKGLGYEDAEEPEDVAALEDAAPGSPVSPAKKRFQDAVRRVQDDIRSSGGSDDEESEDDESEVAEEGALREDDESAEEKPTLSPAKQKFQGAVHKVQDLVRPLHVEEEQDDDEDLEASAESSGRRVASWDELADVAEESPSKRVADWDELSGVEAPK